MIDSKYPMYSLICTFGMLLGIAMADNTLQAGFMKRLAVRVTPLSQLALLC